MSTETLSTVSPGTKSDSAAAAARPVVEQFRSDGCLAYLVFDPRMGEAAVVDPRLGGVDALLARLREGKLTLRYVFDTHTHADHVSGAARLKRETGAEVCQSEHADSLVATRRLRDGDRLPLGRFALEILATPGHTPDSVSIKVGNALFTGDTLLIGSAGRADFLGGDARQLFRSLEEKLRPLARDTVLYPGHDYAGRTHSTLADEWEANAVFADRDEASFLARFAGPKPEEPANMRFVLEANKTGSAASAGRIGAADLQRRLAASERFTLLDVRTPAEFERGRIAGSLSIPLEKVASSLHAVPASDPVVVVCETGNRAALATPLLAGRPGVLILEGGLQAWRKAGHELEGGAPGVWPLERQVRLIVGIAVLAGTGLGFAWSPWFFALAAFFGAGLAFSGLTGFCGLAMVLAKLPWNRRALTAQGSEPASGTCSAAPAGGGCSVGSPGGRGSN